MLIGGGGREHAMGLSIVKSGTELMTISPNRNPGLDRISKKFLLSPDHDTDVILRAAEKYRPDFIFIGPEGPLAAGVSDVLISKGYRVFAPPSRGAKLETSKAFLRQLMNEKGIEGNIDSVTFTDADKAAKFIDSIDHQFVIKPDGLTGGKGVMVQGVHFRTEEEGKAIIRKYIQSDFGRILIERKMEGEEFSLQALVGPDTIRFFPIVQDYKRAGEHDVGPNTGGMGSICFSERGFPFIPSVQVEKAKTILAYIIKSVREEGIDYIGPIYGQFMSTKDGPKVVEINARMGDPEAINVLSLMEESLIEVVTGMYNGSNSIPRFKDMISVLRYAVPIGYGSDPIPGILEIDEERIMGNGLKIFYASVNSRGKFIVQTKSRSFAVLSEGNDLKESVERFGTLKSMIAGEYYMRNDIGNPESIKEKIDLMGDLIK